MKLTPLPLAVLFSSSLCAQIPTEPRHGPFSTTGLGFATTGPMNQLHHFRADEQDVVLFEPIGASGALYRIDEIFASLLNAHPALQGSIEIDAIATGNDVVPVSLVSSQFRINPRRAALGWSALFLSFRLNSVSPTGPMPMAARSAAGWAGGDLYSWIVPGSVPLGEFEDEIFLDVPAASLELTPNQELAVLDIPLAVLAQNGGTPDPLFAPYLNRIFFSLTKQSAATLTNVLPGIAAADVSGATVFTSYWSGQGWGPIGVAKHPFELGLAGANGASPVDDEELDALAVEGPLATVVVYSVKGPTLLPQLMTATGSGWGELFTETGDPVTSRIGDSDIDAICGIDPEAGFFSRWVGTPIADAPPSLIFSATQMYSAPAPGQHTIVMNVNGEFTSDGTLTAGPLALQVSSSPSVDADAWTTFWVVPQWNAAGTYQLVLPITFTLNVPVQLRAVLQPAGQAPIVSTSIGTIL